MRIISKKAQTADTSMIFTGVSVFIVVGFLFIFGMIFLDDIFFSNVADSSQTVDNETFAWYPDGIAVAGNSTAGTCGASNFGLVVVTYSENYTIIDNNNFSLHSVTGVLTVNVTAEGYTAYLSNVTLNVTYSYNYGAGAVCDAANKTYAGQGLFADYIDLMILAVIIAVIISLLLGAFAMRKVR